MKLKKFRPLRRVKKTGKIVIASYSLWRSVRTSNYNEFDLVVDPEYQSLPDNEIVHNHKGEELFFFSGLTPESIPVFAWPYDYQFIRENYSKYGLTYGGPVNYCCQGLDCDGVPCFSHYSVSNVEKFYMKYINELEPLTVGIVKKWYGWFLLNLDNATVKIKV